MFLSLLCLLRLWLFIYYTVLFFHDTPTIYFFFFSIKTLFSFSFSKYQLFPFINNDSNSVFFQDTIQGPGCSLDFCHCADLRCRVLPHGRLLALAHGGPGVRPGQRLPGSQWVELWRIDPQSLIVHGVSLRFFGKFD
jgi:hypothetical protein